MFRKIYRNENICVDADFAECAQELGESSRGLGDCQINTIVGLYNALNIPFSLNDKNYVDSYGDSLGDEANLYNVYDYLTNRESMRNLLFENSLNPQNLLVLPPDHRPPFSVLSKNKLYPIYIGTYIQRNNNFTSTRLSRSRHELEREPLDYGHNLLMYKTDYAGLVSFLAYVNPSGGAAGGTYTQRRNKKQSIIDNMVQIAELLEGHGDLNQKFRAGISFIDPDSGEMSLPSDEQERMEPVRRNGNVCIMIDYCNKSFYAVTDTDYPSTIALLNDGNPPTDPAELIEYNTLWMLKINIKYLVYGQNSQYLSSSIPSLDVLYIADMSQNIDQTDTLLTQKFEFEQRWIYSAEFRNLFLFYAYIPETMDPAYSAPDEVNLKPGGSFYGKLNTICRDEVGNECNQSLYCEHDILQSGQLFNICVSPGDEDRYCQVNRCNSENLLCTDMGGGSKRCIDRTKIVLIPMQKTLQKMQNSVLVPVNVNGFVYVFNPNFSGQVYHLPSLDQLQSTMIYLGDFKKQSTANQFYWQKKSFFLEWNNRIKKFYLMYCEPDKDISSNENIVLDIKFILPIRNLSNVNPSFFKLGKLDDTSQDNYITIYFELERAGVDAHRPMQLYTDNNSTLQNLNHILTYVNNLLLVEQQSPSSTVPEGVPGVACSARPTKHYF